MSPEIYKDKTSFDKSLIFRVVKEYQLRLMPPFFYVRLQMPKRKTFLIIYLVKIKYIIPEFLLISKS